MGKPVINSNQDLYDLDARNDPFLAEYEKARDLLQTSEWRRGLQEIERLAYGGSIMSILLVSDAMRAGWMYDQDLSGAEAWYRTAVDSGSARGLFGLGLTYLLMDRYVEAIRQLEAAIDRNYPPALNALAGMYFRGDGVPIDVRRAVKLWRKGASLGHLPSKRNLVQQSLRGRLGPWSYVLGAISLLPVVVEMAIVRTTNRFTDRLR
ncbi:tetratricopeptide repeat protein [Phenylobacterium sp.]|jgi:TPR repeat protein|uniref:tetratricopeptide repeat protein n=1 Tax=Phenylobacterium sp. TaxID=1871053 RepID=UPI0037CA5643